jgi:hypothetical protein
MLRNLLCLLLISLMPIAAVAAAVPQAITFTVGGGYLFFATKRDLRNTGIPAFTGISYNFDERWATQIAANLINTTPKGSKQAVHGFIYLFDEIYRLPVYRSFEPYVLGGFNVISLKPITNQTVNQGGVNLGLGTEFLKSKNASVSIEARDLYTFSLNFGINFIWA